MSLHKGRSVNRRRHRGFTPNPSPYQQVPGPNQHNQNHASQAGPTQQPPYQLTPQYGNSGQQYPYNPPQPHQAQQPQYPYGQPPQYGQPAFQPAFQQPSYNQRPPDGPPHFSTPAYHGPPQQFAPSAPVPYQQPSNPYPPVNASYGGAYQVPPVSYQPPQPVTNQWSNAAPAVQPTYQQQQPHGSGQRGYSGPPIQQAQRSRSTSRQVSQTFAPAQPGHPQTPKSNSGSAHQASRRGSMASPKSKPEDMQAASSRASTPYGRSGSCDRMQLGGQLLTPSASQNQGLEQNSHGESEQFNEEDLFNWNFKHIFTEPARDETVELAQPLSANFNSTPVPLVQAWSTDVSSISRYARKDNLKEFIRPIRELPQWSYSQEDPAFSDFKRGWPSIPLEHLPYWITAHHEEMDRQVIEEPPQEPLETADEPTEQSRKRGRSEEAEESSQDYHNEDNGSVKDELSTDEGTGTSRAKRLKQVAEKDADEMMSVPTARTPVIGYRSGTPCFETEGDAWAPEPGETASTPQDPTEALLASLGVTGSPKPIRKESIPAYMYNLEEAPRPSQLTQPIVATQENPKLSPDSQPVRESSTTQQSAPAVPNGRPVNNDVSPPGNDQNAPTRHHQYGPQMNTSFPLGQTINAQYGPQTVNRHQAPSINHQYGAPVSGPYVNGQVANPPYGNPPVGNFSQGQQYRGTAHIPYQNGPPQNYGQPPNGPHVNGPSPPNNYGPPQQDQSQLAPPSHQPYTHGRTAYAPLGHTPYPQPNAPYVNQPHIPANGPYQTPPGPYYPPGPPQYAQQSGSYYGNGAPIASNHGLPTQESPTQHVPPQHAQYNPNMQFGSAPQPQFGQNQAGPYHSGNGPPGDAMLTSDRPQQSVCGPYGNAPPRQDSGYMSAREPYSNETSPHDCNRNHSHPVPPLHSTMDGTSSPKPEHPSKEEENESSLEMTRKDSDTGSPVMTPTGTPLSPTSKEILGMLEGEPNSADVRRAKAAARKMRRPQPVVAEAYRFAILYRSDFKANLHSRRW
ncbi:uncharacterized protein RSE6_02148 [Rhynchosporium secalis]|uniref:Uncharacterized protein n=1 Tax=Rhynchosporium secalis TaxID=38038 RepID=A0A1E1LZJ9_RHYSE|nr:uncharacterized protein RSE6_02148 [Rhynchosporium secalis]